MTATARASIASVVALFVVTACPAEKPAEPSGEPPELAPWESPETMAPTPKLPDDTPGEKMPMPPEATDPAASADAGAAAAPDAPGDGSATAAADKPATDAPADTKPATEKPAADKPAADKPAVAAKKPAAPVAFEIATAGKANFLIDAPLEKIKGRWSRFGGRLMIDVSDLNKTRGEVLMDLSTLRTYTFGDPGKDQRQTGHALNWMEIGPDVSPEKRKQYSVARFTIESISGATGNSGTQNVTAKGKLTLHGITLPQTVKLTVDLEGPAGAPTSVRIRTASPMIVSMEGHDVKPRDLAGRFLAGALEKVGEKVTDKTQVTFDIQASPAGG